MAYELARTGTIPLSSKEMSKRIGALIVQKNMVNLETDILETPEYFWCVMAMVAGNLRMRRSRVSHAGT